MFELGLNLEDASLAKVGPLLILIGFVATYTDLIRKEALTLRNLKEGFVPVLIVFLIKRYSILHILSFPLMPLITASTTSSPILIRSKLLASNQCIILASASRLLLRADCSMVAAALVASTTS